MHKNVPILGKSANLIQLHTAGVNELEIVMWLWAIFHDVHPEQSLSLGMCVL